MVRAQAQSLIARPHQVVFRFVATDFFKNYRRWSPEVIYLKPTSLGPVRLGSTGWQVRVDHGRRTEAHFRVSRFEEFSRVDFKGISAPILSSYRFVEVNGKTRLTFLFELSRVDLFMRPFEELIRVKVQQGAQRVVWNIKRLIEAECVGIHRE